MPNLIEQQDLLKGLPDARLATLLQQPTGDIPPFLVAAEAQRRQAIRQQFAGPGSQESVVDTLTKQMTGSQENLKAAPSPTPPVPATPQMQGVAALQQQQAAQPQGMRYGGAVRRFAGTGYVDPKVGERVKMIADQFGISVDDAAKMLESKPEMLADKPEDQYGISPVIPETNQEPPASAYGFDWVGVTTSQAEYDKKMRERQREAKYNEMDNYGGYAGRMPSTGAGMSTDEIVKENEAMLRRAKAAEAANPQAAGTRPPEDDYLTQLQKLYASQEPSDWEKAQKWFDMSAQFLDPSKTTMQSLSAAGAAFAGASADQEKQKRQFEFERNKALLEAKQGLKTTATQNTIESLKYQAEQATEDAKNAVEEAKSADKALSDYQEAKSGMLKPDDPTYLSLTKQAEDARQRAQDATAMSRYYRKQYGQLMGTYGNPMVWRDGKLVPIGG